METYLQSARKQFEYYKMLGEKTITRLDYEGLNRRYNAEFNSVATLVQHLHGNMLSRWTNFLHEDGEKPWRRRDEEFEPLELGEQRVYQLWMEGWGCLFTALESIKPEHYEHTIYIRNQGHTVTDAVNRQLCHYAYHVGQIVLIGKLILGESWQSLSIPRGESHTYNAEKFAREREMRHFTDEFLRDNTSGEIGS